MDIQFRTIDLVKDREIVLSFFKETLLASGFNESFDKVEYINKLKEKVHAYPDGYVLVEIDQEISGILELQIKEYEGLKVGYVSNYFLIKKYRSTGISRSFIEYTESLFKKWGLETYHLRVSKSNTRAIRFYEKHGFSVLKEEINSLGIPSYRMFKKLD